jgi:hypothetical protein
LDIDETSEPWRAIKEVRTNELKGRTPVRILDLSQLTIKIDRSLATFRERSSQFGLKLIEVISQPDFGLIGQANQVRR